MDSDLDTLLGLVQRYSPSGSEGEAARWLVNRMAALGYEQAFLDGAGNPVGIKGNGAKQILLVGHIDTVPGEIAIHIENDHLYGRGAVDAKGPLAAFTDAAAQVEPAADWQIVVIGAVGEEADSPGARYIAGRYQPTFAIFGEPCGWNRLGLGYMGSAWAELAVERPQAHPASGQETACEQAVHAWSQIQAWAKEYNEGRQRKFESVLVSLRGMASGQDGFVQWAKLNLMARLPVELSPTVWYQQLASLLPEARITPLGEALGAYQSEKNSLLVRAFLSAIRAQGGTPAFVNKTGTSDLNILGPIWGCPALVYGAGDSNLDHTPDEHLSMTEYRASVRVLVDGLRELMGKEAERRRYPEADPLS